MAIRSLGAWQEGAGVPRKDYGADEARAREESMRRERASAQSESDSRYNRMIQGQAIAHKKALLAADESQFNTTQMRMRQEHADREARYGRQDLEATRQFDRSSEYTQARERTRKSERGEDQAYGKSQTRKAQSRQSELDKQTQANKERTADQRVEEEAGRNSRAKGIRDAAERASKRAAGAKSRDRAKKEYDKKAKEWDAGKKLHLEERLQIENQLREAAKLDSGNRGLALGDISRAAIAADNLEGRGNVRQRWIHDAIINDPRLKNLFQESRMPTAGSLHESLGESRSVIDQRLLLEQERMRGQEDDIPGEKGFGYGDRPVWVEPSYDGSSSRSSRGGGRGHGGGGYSGVYSGPGFANPTPERDDGHGFGAMAPQQPAPRPPVDASRYTPSELDQHLKDQYQRGESGPITPGGGTLRDQTTRLAEEEDRWQTHGDRGREGQAEEDRFQGMLRREREIAAAKQAGDALRTEMERRELESATNPAGPDFDSRDLFRRPVEGPAMPPPPGPDYPPPEAYHAEEARPEGQLPGDLPPLPSDQLDDQSGNPYDPPGRSAAALALDLHGAGGATDSDTAQGILDALEFYDRVGGVLSGGALAILREYMETRQ